MTYGPFGESAIDDQAKARGLLDHQNPLGATRTGQVSWAFWEFGANAYVILITIYIFAPYFSSQVVGDEVRGQALWGYINGAAGLAIGILAPVLGSIADTSGQRKPWLVFFVALMIPGLLAIWFALPNEAGLSILTIAILITMISVTYEFATLFHNAMLPGIVSERRIGGLSGLGLALGNAGSLVLLLFLMWGFALPGQFDSPFLPDAPLFGLDPEAHEPSRLSGPIVAVWVLIFTIPLLLFTPDTGRAAVPPLKAMRDGIISLRKTLGRLTRSYKNIALFLLARMLYNDGKTAIMIFGGVYASGVFGWELLELLIYSISLSVFAVLGGLIGGLLDDKVGSRMAVILTIGLTTAALIVAVSITPDTILFVVPIADPDAAVWGSPVLNTQAEVAYMIVGWFLAISISGAYAVSRTMLARIAPQERMSEFFGLYALSGKATAFLAPIMVGFFTQIFADQRMGFASIVLLLLSGLVLMIYVRQERSPLAVD